MGSPTVKRIFNQDISQGTKPKLRVCAYCRVSSNGQHSLEMRYYLNAILRCSKGLTGSKAQGRIMGCVSS